MATVLYQVRSIPYPVRRLRGRNPEDLRIREQEEERYSVSVGYRASGTPWTSFDQLPLYVLYVLYTLLIRDRPKCFGWLSYRDIKIAILTPGAMLLDDGTAANMKQEGKR